MGQFGGLSVDKRLFISTGQVVRVRSDAYGRQRDQQGRRNENE